MGIRHLTLIMMSSILLITGPLMADEPRLDDPLLRDSFVKLHGLSDSVKRSQGPRLCGVSEWPGGGLAGEIDDLLDPASGIDLISTCDDFTCFAGIVFDFAFPAWIGDSWASFELDIPRGASIIVALKNWEYGGFDEVVMIKDAGLKPGSQRLTVNPLPTADFAYRSAAGKVQVALLMEYPFVPPCPLCVTDAITVRTTTIGPS